MKNIERQKAEDLIIALRFTGFLLALGAIPLFFEYNNKFLAIAIWAISILFLFFPKKCLIKKELKI